MLWYKEWANSDSHPKIVAAGFWGATVFRALCRTSAEFDLNGRIPQQYATPAYLSHRLQLAAEDDWSDPHATECNAATRVQRGVDAAVAAGLLVRDGAFLVIDGWGDRQSVSGGSGKTSTERSRALRERRKTPATECNAAPLQATDATPDQSRSEKKEKIRPEGGGGIEDLWQAFKDARATLSDTGPDGFSPVPTPRPPEAQKPVGWDEWSAVALGEVGADAVPRLVCAYRIWLRDKRGEWAKKRPVPWPTQVFMSPNVWKSRVPEARGAA